MNKKIKPKSRKYISVPFDRFHTHYDNANDSRGDVPKSKAWIERLKKRMKAKGAFLLIRSNWMFQVWELKSGKLRQWS